MRSVFISIPYIGSLFNGTGYPTNRFIFGLTFLVSFIVVIMIPKFYDMSDKQIKSVYLISCLFGIYIFMFHTMRTKRNLGSMICLCILLSCCMAYKLEIFKYKKRLLSLIMVFVMLVLNAHFSFSPLEEEKLINNYLDKDSAAQIMLGKSPALAVQELEKNNERYDTNVASAYYQNAAVLKQQKGVSLYYSTCNQNVGKITTAIALNNTTDYNLYNLDGRTYLEALFGAKYYVTDAGSNTKVPYGHHALAKSQNGYQVYASDYDMGMAFTGKEYISQSVYNALTISQKQQALLQGIVLEKSNGLKTADLQFDDQNKQYQFVNQNGVSFQKNKFEVTSKNASIELEFQGSQESEYYVTFNNIHFDGKRVANLYNEEELSNKSYVEMKTIKESMLYNKPSVGRITAELNGTQKGISVLSKEAVNYAGKSDFLMNLGYYDQAVNKIKLTFSETGTYTFDNLSVVCQPMSSFDRDMKKREKHIVKDISFGTNTMDMNVNESDDSMLFVAIPYNKGWSATVNGKKVEVQKADDTCMAVKVPKGASKVHWTYTNSYFVMGAGISGVAWIGFFAFAVYERRKRKYKTTSISS